MKINGRKLIHKISIEKLLEIKNEIGGSTTEWIEFAPAYAEVKPISGKEFLSAKAHQNSVTHRIIIRWVKGISPSMRVKHKNRVFNIEAVRDYFEREIWIEMLVRSQYE